MSQHDPKATPRSTKSFLELPYNERQRIVVVNDPGDPQLDKMRADLDKTLGRVDARAPVARIRGRAVTKTEARDVAFPVGHPRSDVLYIGHPAVPSIYYTTAQFHQKTFEHKFSEAIQLLMSLGAKHIEVEYVAGWSNDFAAHLNVSLAPAASAGASLGRDHKSGAHLLFVANLSGSTSPRLPDGLVWYPHEPNWQQVAKGRLEFGLQDFSLTVNYTDDFGVNAGLQASAVQAS